MFIVINSKTGKKQHVGGYETRTDAYMKMLSLEQEDVNVYNNLQSYEVVEVTDEE